MFLSISSRIQAWWFICCSVFGFGFFSWAFFNEAESICIIS